MSRAAEAIIEYYRRKGYLNVHFLKTLKGLSLLRALYAVDANVRAYCRIKYGSPTRVTSPDNIEVLQGVLNDYPDVSPKDMLLALNEVFIKTGRI